MACRWRAGLPCEPAGESAGGLEYGGRASDPLMAQLKWVDCAAATRQPDFKPNKLFEDLEGKQVSLTQCLPTQLLI